MLCRIAAAGTTAAVHKAGKLAQWDSMAAAPVPPAATLIEMPLLAIVPEALVPAKAAVAATKLLPALLCIAVVRN